MGLTYQQAKELLPPEYAEMHPAVSGAPSKERELLERVYAAEKPASKAPKDGMNKLERSFKDEVLEPAYVRGAILDWHREPIKLRLAGRCWFHPDFVVCLPAGEHGLAPRIAMVEVKGPFAREDSIVKLKVAATTYSYFDWWIVRREGRRDWDVRAVNSAGIGAVSRRVSWIHGEA